MRVDMMYFRVLHFVYVGCQLVECIEEVCNFAWRKSVHRRILIQKLGILMYDHFEAEPNERRKGWRGTSIYRSKTRKNSWYP